MTISEREEAVKYKISALFLCSFIIYGQPTGVVGVGLSQESSMHESVESHRYYVVPLTALTQGPWQLNQTTLSYRLGGNETFQAGVYINPLSGFYEGYSIVGDQMKNGFNAIRQRTPVVEWGGVIRYTPMTPLETILEWGNSAVGSRADFSLLFSMVDDDHALRWIPFVKLKYLSSGYGNHFFGVSFSEFVANSQIETPYQFSSSFIYEGGILCEWVIEEPWMLSSWMSVTTLPEALTRSPIVQKQSNSYQIGIGLEYYL